MTIDRVNNISKSQFLEQYLIPKKPVIITDAMAGWQMDKFQPAYLSRTFGKHDVQIYDDLFELQTIDTLHNYLQNYFDRPSGAPGKPMYIRWYTKLRSVDFFWADEVFRLLSGFWSHPYFLPNDEFVIPWTADGEKADINEAYYPYKGLFISCRGARTRLHKDPFNSNAVLCQFYGEKKIVLYAPDQEPYVMNVRGEFLDVAHPDSGRFPEFRKAMPSYEDVLRPGETVLFPSGWFHDVVCASDSVSITWNFVHQTEKPALADYIRHHPNDSQLEIVRFFLRNKLSGTASVEEIADLLEGESILL